MRCSPNLVRLASTPIRDAGPFGNIAQWAIALLSGPTGAALRGICPHGSRIGSDKRGKSSSTSSAAHQACGLMRASLSRRCARSSCMVGGTGRSNPGSPLPRVDGTGIRRRWSRGFANLEQHIANVRAHGGWVAVNAFKDDSPQELDWVCERALAAEPRRPPYRHIGPMAEKARKNWLGQSSRWRRKGHSSRTLYDATIAHQEKRSRPLRLTIYGVAGVSYSAQAEKTSNGGAIGLRAVAHLYGEDARCRSRTTRHSKGRLSASCPFRSYESTRRAQVSPRLSVQTFSSCRAPKKPARRASARDPRSGEIVRPI